MKPLQRTTYQEMTAIETRFNCDDIPYTLHESSFSGQTRKTEKLGKFAEKAL